MQCTCLVQSVCCGLFLLPVWLPAPCLQPLQALSLFWDSAAREETVLPIPDEIALLPAC